MNIRLIALSVLIACDPPPEAPAEPDTEPTVGRPRPAAYWQTDADKTLYALGQSIGQSLTPFQLTPDELKRVEAGLEDYVTGKPAQVEMTVYGPKIQDLASGRAAAAAEGNRSKSKAFLDQLAATPGAAVTASGIVFMDVAPGTGASPTVTDVVKVHYRGTLADGTEFDSSYSRGQPAEFGLSEVVPCWTEGIQKMKVGGKAKLGCPSNLAYGDHGVGGIPGGAALLFEVELLDIKK